MAVPNVVTRVSTYSEDAPALAGVPQFRMSHETCPTRGACQSNWRVDRTVMCPKGPAKEGGLKPVTYRLALGRAVRVEDTRGSGPSGWATAPLGASSRVTVLREGKSQTLKFKLGRREDAERDQDHRVRHQRTQHSPKRLQ